MVMQYLPEAVWLVQSRSLSRPKQWKTLAQEPDQVTALLVARHFITMHPEKAFENDEYVRVVRMAPSSVIYVNGQGEARIQQ